MRDPFETVMILLPIWLPALLIGILIQWLVIRGAVLSALRKHSWERSREVGSPAEPGALGGASEPEAPSAP